MKHKSVDRSKRVSVQCRNNNQCPHCRRSRTRSTAKVMQDYRERITEWLDSMWCHR
jgi:DNA-binding IscR family transcriptional regulator